MFLNFGKKNSSVKKPTTSVGSPKPRSSPSLNSSGSGGVNAVSRSTVQTIAGPLLSSSRFNTILDASTYANVNSPGFTSRVVNCATNGTNTSPYRENNATHHSKYSSVGLFPRVQLGQSILPTLSPQNSQKVRTLVRVRIAPPSLHNRRQNSLCSPPESIKEKNDTNCTKLSSSFNQQTLNDASRVDDKGSSVIDNVQEASRKRIFSESQDVSDESKKRRKKAELPIPNPNDDTYHYKHVRVLAVPSSPPQPDFTSQGKRAREKGSPEEQKRQRRKVCNTNNAIFSSLSSSRNLLERISAQKRKSADTSRSSSPLTPLSGKQVKDSKSATNAKAIQCNLDEIPLRVKFSLDTNQQHDTPVSTKGILKRVDSNVKETAGVLQEKSQPNTTPDYTTKLFRKEVSSHTPRTPTSRTLKQSMWVQPTEADELSSLLNDDSNLHRPERLKSLLACVSGKDNKEEKKTVDVVTTSTTTPSISLPVSQSIGLKPLSPSGGLSAALTVTVSSTCTIMTSATVTSVNGIPSSESGSSPRPLMSAALSFNSIKPTPTDATVKTPVLPSLTAPVTLVSSPQPMPGQVASKAAPMFNSSSSALCADSPVIGQGTAISNVPKNVTQTSNMFSIKSPTKTAEVQQLETAQTNSATAKPMFQFGSNTQVSIVASPAIPAASTAAASAGVNSASQFASGASNLAASSVSTFGASADAAKPTFTFGSSGDSRETFQIGTTNSAAKSSGSDPTTASKPTFSFGSSGNLSSAVPQTSFQLGSSGSVSAEVPKPAFQFGSSASNTSFTTSTNQLGSAGIKNASSEAPRSAFQFGSSTTSSPNPAFQLGSANGLSTTPSSTFQFTSPTSQGPSSVVPKSAFQLGSSLPSNNGPSDIQKPSFSFGSSSDTSKSNFQFGSSNGSTTEASKSTPSFGSSTSNSLTTPAKSAFQFGGVSSGPTPTAPANSPFQFSSNSLSDTGTSKPAFSFGSSGNKPTQPAFSSTVQSPPSPFGQAAPQQAKPAFSFGSPANQNTNGSNENKGAFSFSSPTNNKSGFSFGASMNSSTNGSTDNKSAFAFSTSAKPSTNKPAENKSTFSFGTSANPITNGPTNNMSSFSFGSSGPTFGSATPNSSFGSGPTSSAFGAPASNSQASLPSFGSLTESKTSGFGSTPSFGSSGTSAFSFSSSTSSSSANSGSANSFGAAPSGITNGAFSFGQKQDQVSTGFNFNATVTAVPNPAQATQAPGLFSIGAGASSTQRRVRDARRRR